MAALAQAKGAVWTAWRHQHPDVRGSTEPEEVAVVMDVPDMDALNAVMQSPAAAEAMAHDGVVPETLVILVEA